MEPGLCKQPLMLWVAQLPALYRMCFARGGFFLWQGSRWLVLPQGQPALALCSEPAHTGHMGTQKEAAWVGSVVVLGTQLWGAIFGIILPFHSTLYNDEQAQRPNKTGILPYSLRLQYIPLFYAQ